MSKEIAEIADARIAALLAGDTVRFKALTEQLRELSPRVTRAELRALEYSLTLLKETKNLLAWGVIACPWCDHPQVPNASVRWCEQAHVPCESCGQPIKLRCEVCVEKG